MEDINHRLPDVASDEKQLRYATFADGALQERIEFLPGSVTRRTAMCGTGFRPAERIAFKAGSNHASGWRGE